MNDLPRALILKSEHYDDVYFSVHDGLAESRHVFLQGNNLPERLEAFEQESFTICETGFGTGLNFLSFWQMWKAQKEENRPKRFKYISFEKYPLTNEFIKENLSYWEESLGEVLKQYLDIYPAGLNQKKYILPVGEDGELILVFGDVNEEMPKLQDKVDCWFLDGFKPSCNPDMWSETVFQNMARLSNSDASFATFTAAGFVRRGLERVGFDVRKVKGYGRKREMCIGTYKGRWSCA
ncbi:MAG: tRNA (5-methylaminomethyl-2-thiouridine)(34)-methyltransferase MnmD [Alphaproteobacteria bacterium]|nr:tRNA (5-methylaminomethyl-2-thiouridine)(34)-methyltransferase MnmD [Alphaproteobacteria bacterium]